MATVHDLNKEPKLFVFPFAVYTAEEQCTHNYVWNFFLAGLPGLVLNIALETVT